MHNEEHILLYEQKNLTDSGLNKQVFAFIWPKIL